MLDVLVAAKLPALVKAVGGLAKVWVSVRVRVRVRTLPLTLTLTLTLTQVLTSATICELYLDPTLLSAREAAQLQHKLLKNREQAQLEQEHFDLGADAPPTSLPSSRTSSFARRGRRQLSWGRAPERRAAPQAETPPISPPYLPHISPNLAQLARGCAAERHAIAQQ